MISLVFSDGYLTGAQCTVSNKSTPVSTPAELTAELGRVSGVLRVFSTAQLDLYNGQVR